MSNSLKEKGQKHMETCSCQEVLVTSDGQVFHTKDKSFADAHRFKVGGDLLLVKKEKAVEKEEKVEEAAQESKQEVQPKKQVKKPRGRRKSSK